jgi:SAM-dependent methyltransferase
MSDFAAFKELEIRGWTDASKAAGYVNLFAQASNQAIGPLLDAVGANSGLDALDLCCGQGNVSEALIARGCKVTGADFSPAMLEMARRRVPGATLVEADAQDLPFADSTFDIVVSNLGICHVPDQPLALRQARRVLKPGGQFGMTVWCGPPVGTAYGMLYNAIKTLGAPEIAAPPGPDFHLFADRAAAERLLSEAGFSIVKHTIVDCAWQYDRPDGFVQMFEHGTVRAAMVLASQPSQNREAIRKALTDEVRARFGNGNRWRVPAPAALISATASPRP